MMRLEQMAAAVVCASDDDQRLPTIQKTSLPIAAAFNGPTPILGGQDPQAGTVVSAPFTARVESI